MKKTILAFTTLAALHAAPAAFGAGPDPTATPATTPTSAPAPTPTATPTPAAKTVGLFLNEPEAFDGYTLFNKIRSKTIYLIDNQGRVVHKWELDAESLFARLLENGNLMTFANQGEGRYPSVREVDRNGNILWDCTQGMPHHDFLKMPNGNVLGCRSETAPSSGPLTRKRHHVVRYVDFSPIGA